MRDILRYVINKERMRKPVQLRKQLCCSLKYYSVASLQVEFRSLKCFVLLQSKNRTLHLKDAE